MTEAILQAEIAADCDFFDEQAGARSRSSISPARRSLSLCYLFIASGFGGQLFHSPYVAISGIEREILL